MCIHLQASCLLIRVPLRNLFVGHCWELREGGPRHHGRVLDPILLLLDQLNHPQNNQAAHLQNHEELQDCLRGFEQPVQVYFEWGVGTSGSVRLELILCVMSNDRVEYQGKFEVRGCSRILITERFLCLYFRGWRACFIVGILMFWGCCCCYGVGAVIG